MDITKKFGAVGTTSNKIKMHRTTDDGTYTLPEDIVLESVVIGVPTTTVEEGGGVDANT